MLVSKLRDTDGTKTQNTSASDVQMHDNIPQGTRVGPWCHHYENPRPCISVPAHSSLSISLISLSLSLCKGQHYLQHQLNRLSQLVLNITQQVFNHFLLFKLTATSSDVLFCNIYKITSESYQRRFIKMLSNYVPSPL